MGNDKAQSIEFTLICPRPAPPRLDRSRCSRPLDAARRNVKTRRENASGALARATEGSDSTPHCLPETGQNEKEKTPPGEPFGQLLGGVPNASRASSARNRSDKRQLLTAITFGFVCSLLGSVMFSTPSAKLASIFPSSTLAGKGIVRQNEP